MGNYPPTAYKGGLKGGLRDRSSSLRSKSSKTKAAKKHFSSRSTDGSLTDDERSDKTMNCRVYRQNQPLPDDAPPEIKVVRQYLYDKDAHNFEGMQSVTDDRCYFYFVDAEAEMPETEFYEALKDTYEAFPNLHFFWKLMKTSGIDSATGGAVVKVKDYYGIGKHTGKPYAFGPYEAIPATNKIVQDENIEFTFIVKNEKIIYGKIDAFGKIVGPPGFYTKIGGCIPLLDMD